MFRTWCKFTATVPHVLIGRWLPQLDSGLDGLDLFRPMLAIRKLLGKLKFCPYMILGKSTSGFVADRKPNVHFGMACHTHCHDRWRKVAISLHLVIAVKSASLQNRTQSNVLVQAISLVTLMPATYLKLLSGSGRLSNSLFGVTSP